MYGRTDTEPNPVCIGGITTAVLLHDVSTVYVYLSVCLYLSLTLSVCESVWLAVSRAADEYIVRHFDKYKQSAAALSGNVDVSVLRVYDPHRRTSTVSDEVKRYCLTSTDAGGFIAPTRADVIRHNVIVTTLVTSLMLTKLNVSGLFTHLFIDEAAQVCLLAYLLTYLLTYLLLYCV